MNGKVYAFEPDPSNLRKMEDNIALNRMDNVFAVPRAMWASDGEMEMNQAGQGSALKAVADKPSSIKVATGTLDSAIKEFGLDRVHLLKMDIEGAELGALEGGSHFLDHACDNLAIATYHLVDGKRTAERVEEILTSKGYDAYTGHESHLTTYGARRRPV